MALCRVAYAVYTLHNGVQRSVVAYRRVGAIQVVVDGSRQSDAAHVILARKLHSSCQRSVSSNNHQRVNLLFLQCGIRLFLTLRSHKLLGARRAQYRSTLHNDARHILGSEWLHLIINEAVIASVNGFDVKPVAYSRTGYRTNSCIHTRRVATRGHNAYCLNLCHSLCCYF